MFPCPPWILLESAPALGMLIHSKLISAPLEAKAVPLGQLRKRGRWQKPKKA